jgi:hypothetical protein
MELAKPSKRDKYLTKKYGITEVDYEQMLASHDGCCWICSRPPKIIRLSVDHHHLTKKQKKQGMVEWNRGLLCFSCNTGLRKFSDSPEKLEAAAQYLRNAQPKV